LPVPAMPCLRELRELTDFPIAEDGPLDLRPLVLAASFCLSVRGRGVAGAVISAVHPLTSASRVGLMGGAPLGFEVEDSGGSGARRSRLGYSKVS